MVAELGNKIVRTSLNVSPATTFPPDMSPHQTVYKAGGWGTESGFILATQ